MPTAVLEPVLSGIPLRFPPVPFPLVKSVWATKPPITADPFKIANWTDAAVMVIPPKFSVKPLPPLRIPETFVMVKNDHEYLYMLVDLIHDTSKFPANSTDTFHLSFDVDGNGKITPNCDVDYTMYRGLLPLPPRKGLVLGKHLYTGPNKWTIPLTTKTSTVRAQFGPSMHSRTDHCMLEFKIDLKEITPRFLFPWRMDPFRLRHGIRFGLSVTSAKLEFPPKFESDFSHLPGILLATRPSLPATTDKPIAGVGWIPIGMIKQTVGAVDEGRATTDPGYYLPCDKTAFGDVLTFIGDKNVLKDLLTPTAKYRVKVDGKVVVQSWGNYHLIGDQWYWEAFAPDGDGYYSLIDPKETYSIDHLLFEWNTYDPNSGADTTTGLHTVQIEFKDATRACTQNLTLMIDNHLPEVHLESISYPDPDPTHVGMWKQILPCDIVNLTTATGTQPVKIIYTAHDDEGGMRWYGLDGRYGAGQAVTPPLIPTTTDGTGVVSAELTTDPATFPPTTCAYEFLLWAHANVVNGSAYVGYVEDTLHVTLQVMRPTT